MSSIKRTQSYYLTDCLGCAVFLPIWWIMYFNDTKNEIITCTIGFLDPGNVGLAIKINVPSYLEAKILQNICFMAAIL